MGRDSDLNDQRRLQAIKDAAALGPRLLDRFGRPILIGGAIELHDGLPPVYTVAEAKPDLRPNAQPGIWILTLVAEMPLVCANGQTMNKITVVAMPQVSPAEGEQHQPPAVEDPAASDAPSTEPPSGIVLTDLDKTAREELGKVEPRSSLSLVPPVAPPAKPDAEPDAEATPEPEPSAPSDHPEDH